MVATKINYLFLFFAFSMIDNCSSIVGYCYAVLFPQLHFILLWFIVISFYSHNYISFHCRLLLCRPFGLVCRFFWAAWFFLSGIDTILAHNAAIAKLWEWFATKINYLSNFIISNINKCSSVCFIYGCPSGNIFVNIFNADFVNSMLLS